jgi:hypothetical protein
MTLSNNQLKHLAEFTSNLSLIFFASVVAPLFSKIDNVYIASVIWGLILGFTFLALSLFLVNIKKR